MLKNVFKKESNMNQEKLNKNCVVTGASGGIGKEISEVLAKKGCNLFLISTNSQKLSEIKKHIQSLSDVKIFTYATDLTKIENLKQTVSEIRKNFDNVDILINSAGIFNVNSVHDSTLDQFEKSFSLNVRAPFYFSKIFSEDMVKQKWGRIVNLGSSSSYSGFSNGSVYCATKHAVLGLSRALHAELKDNNVRCFCVSPSSTRTDMAKISSDQNFETFLDPFEVAEAIVFAISFDENLVMDEIRLNRMKIE